MEHRMIDRAPGIPAAGANSQRGTETAAEALFMVDPNRPPTPEHIRRHQARTRGEPGQRVIHWALVGDKKEEDGMARHGVKSEQGESAKLALDRREHSKVIAEGIKRAEAVYLSERRMPLGHHYDHGQVLPDKVKDPKFRHGIVSDRRGENAAGALIHPDASIYVDVDENVKKRHEMKEPGKQVRRNYDWGVDPNDYRFGVTCSRDSHRVGDVLTGRADAVVAAEQAGVEAAALVAGSHAVTRTQILPARVQMRRKGENVIGCGKKRFGYKDDAVHGIASTRGSDSAGALLTGSYTDEQLKPDSDLGRSKHVTLKGRFARDAVVIDPNRRFGIPSIRTDIEPPPNRSIADGQSYGTEANAGAAIQPHDLPSGAILEDYEISREKEEMKDIFKCAGIHIAQKHFEMAWEMGAADNERGLVSVTSFRQQLERVREQAGV